MISGIAFYGVTLDAENKSRTWTQTSIQGPAGGEYITKLAVKQILLGHDAKKDEVNVVEVTTDGWKRDAKPQKIPIAVLKLGETQSSLPNLEFPSGSVKFTLTVGSGPVHISGLQFPDASEDTMVVHEEEYSDEEAEEDNDDDADEDEDEQEVKPRKDGKKK